MQDSSMMATILAAVLMAQVAVCHMVEVGGVDINMPDLRPAGTVQIQSTAYAQPAYTGGKILKREAKIVTVGGVRIEMPNLAPPETVKIESTATSQPKATTPDILRRDPGMVTLAGKVVTEMPDLVPAGTVHIESTAKSQPSPLSSIGKILKRDPANPSPTLTSGGHVFVMPDLAPKGDVTIGNGGPSTTIAVPVILRREAEAFTMPDLSPKGTVVVGSEGPAESEVEAIKQQIPGILRERSPHDAVVTGAPALAHWTSTFATQVKTLPTQDDYEEALRT